jgi:HAD superfamily hydrolase (TIGR01459 family)
MPPETTATFRLEAGMEALAARYDGVIVDLWGVIHDGRQPYPGAIDCLDRLRAAGLQVFLLSNAPRRIAIVAERLAAMGVTPAHYDHLYTSGEAAWEHLAARDDAFHGTLGRRVHHIGVPENRRLFDGLSVELVDSPEAADFVVVSEIDGPNRTLDDYVPELVRCANRRLPMVCANPDLVVNAGTRIVICAGTLAQHYERLGGIVQHHGKPYAPVYHRCRALLGIRDIGRVAAIGDGLRTDILGANNAGIDAVFVVGGIHRADCTLPTDGTPDAVGIARTAAALGVRLDYAIPRFAW